MAYALTYVWLNQCLTSPATPQSSNENGCARPPTPPSASIIVVAVSDRARADGAGGAERRTRHCAHRHRQARIVRPAGARPRHAGARGHAVAPVARPTAASSASCCVPARRSDPDSVILELSNPQVEQEALNARLALQSAQAALENLRVQLETDLLTQESQAAALEADFSRRGCRPKPTRRWPRNSWSPNSPPTVAAHGGNAEEAPRARACSASRRPGSRSTRGPACSRPRSIRRAPCRRCRRAALPR